MGFLIRQFSSLLELDKDDNGSQYQKEKKNGMIT